MRVHSRPFRKYGPLLCALLLGTTATAQTFDLDQFDQLFRPRLRLDAEWLPPADVRTDSSGTYEERSTTAVVTFPLFRRLTVGAQLDLTAGSWKELLQRSVRVRASQVLGNLRFGSRQVMADGLLQQPRELYTASAGLLGISLTRKYRVLFWSANVNISEEDRTMDKAAVRVSGLIGQLHINGLRRNWFYGLAAAWSDGVPIPVPFLGGNTPLGRQTSLQYVLPLQLALVWKADGRTRITAGVGLRGNRTGLELPTERVNMSVVGVRGFAGVRHRLGKHVQLRAEASYLPEQRVLFGVNDLNGLNVAQRVGNGLAVNIGVNILFGDNLLERIVEEVVR